MVRSFTPFTRRWLVRARLFAPVGLRPSVCACALAPAYADGFAASTLWPHYAIMSADPQCTVLNDKALTGVKSASG